MLHAVIMAGGSGTRFWPESRAQWPKQLLSLAGDRSMLRSTWDRIAGLLPRERIHVATNAKLHGAVINQLPDVLPSNVLGEPCKRDTAACIGWSAFHCLREDPDAVMAVMPSDHVIQDVQAFQAALGFAENLVKDSPLRIVTFGIKPSYPAESFGYIERGEKINRAEDVFPAYQAVRFREKPKAAVAAEYVQSGRYYWNSGIFVWRADLILKNLRERQPAMYQHLESIESSFGHAGHAEVLQREFAAIDPISIDYAVLEHASDVAVIEAPFDWDDVGSWNAVRRLGGVDDDGNTTQAKTLSLRSKGTIVRGPDDHLIVTLGLTDCLIVHTKDATLIANRHEEEAIREVVKLLEQQNWTEYL